MTPPPTLAAIDVGTNSTRLLVAEVDEELRRIDRQMRITRLGKGVDASGHLDDGALERTLACIEEFARTARDLGAERLRVAATSAVRDAADRERFFGGVEQRAGVQAEVLTGAEEAAVAFLGATASVEGPAPYWVLDIGGGSTEVIVGTTEPQASTSRQLGCVRLTERALPGDPPPAGEIDAATAIVDAELDAASADLAAAMPAAAMPAAVTPAAAMPAAATRTLVAVAGTATTVGALYLDLPAYLPERIHAARVPLDGVREVTARLAGMTSAARAGLGPMAPGREDVIVAGALILQRAMERFGFDEVVISEADGLDGLVLQMAAEAGAGPRR